MNRKSLYLTFALGLATILQSTPASAQVKQLCQVPFDYQIGNVTMPAGPATVTRANASGIASIAVPGVRNPIFFWGSVPREGNTRQARLVFHRYGNRYFLAEVWFPGDAYGHAAIPSHREKEMALNTKADTVEVAFAMAR